MPDASKAKAKRRARLQEQLEDNKLIEAHEKQLKEKAVAAALVCVPDSYRKIAHNDDMYARTSVTAYYNSEEKDYYLLIDNHDGRLRSVGPLKKKNLQIIIDVIKDVIQPGPHHYLE
jgi:hypothetical protein